MHDERARSALLYGGREDVVNQSNFGQCREAPSECKRKKGLRTAKSHVALIDGAASPAQTSSGSAILWLERPNGEERGNEQHQLRILWHEHCRTACRGVG